MTARSRELTGFVLLVGRVAEKFPVQENNVYKNLLVLFQSLHYTVILLYENGILKALQDFFGSFSRLIQ